MANRDMLPKSAREISQTSARDVLDLTFTAGVCVVDCGRLFSAVGIYIPTVDTGSLTFKKAGHDWSADSDLPVAGHASWQAVADKVPGSDPAAYTVKHSTGGFYIPLDIEVLNGCRFLEITSSGGSSFLAELTVKYI
jgi:hypothetical protein